jgi:uncharacterized protein YjbI with pentapeptide repeats
VSNLDAQAFLKSVRNGGKPENPVLLHMDFSSEDLSGLIFEELILQEVDFSGADLTTASFKHCMMQDVNFHNSRLNEGLKNVCWWDYCQQVQKP